MKISRSLAVRSAAVVLAGGCALAAPAWASGRIAFDLTAGQLCAQAETGSVGDLTLASQPPWCVASTTGGLVEGFITFNPALNSQIPQPPEFFGFFREAQADVVVSFPAPPPAGVQIAAATLLQHLMVVWIFEEDGVSIAPIGDPIAFFQPAPPPYLAGTISGKVRYGEPVEMTVRMTMDSHMLVASQSGSPVAAVTLKKIFRHPDAMSYAAVIQVEGDLPAAELVSFGDGAFQGAKSPAEVIIGSVPPSEETIGRIERVGSEVRVHAP